MYKFVRRHAIIVLCEQIGSEHVPHTFLRFPQELTNLEEQSSAGNAVHYNTASIKIRE